MYVILWFCNSGVHCFRWRLLQSILCSGVCITCAATIPWEKELVVTRTLSMRHSRILSTTAFWKFAKSFRSIFLRLAREFNGDLEHVMKFSFQGMLWVVIALRMTRSCICALRLPSPTLCWCYWAPSTFSSYSSFYCDRELLILFQHAHSFLSQSL